MNQRCNKPRQEKRKTKNKRAAKPKFPLLQHFPEKALQSPIDSSSVTTSVPKPSRHAVPLARPRLPGERIQDSHLADINTAVRDPRVQ